MAKLLFSFEGRVNREPYWLFVLFMFIGMSISTVIDIKTTGQDTGFISVIFVLLILWPSLAIQVKRWHDRDKSGWWVLINFIPIIGPIWALVENGFLAGTAGTNRFGENPLQMPAEG